MEWIAAQGGDASYAKDPALFGQAAHSYSVTAEKDGYIAACNAEMIGTAAMILGAGRQTKDSVIDPRAGILLLKKPGDRIFAGEVLATLYTERAETIDAAANTVRAALTFSQSPIEKAPLIYAVIDGTHQAEV